MEAHTNLKAFGSFFSPVWALPSSTLKVEIYIITGSHYKSKAEILLFYFLKNSFTF